MTIDGKALAEEIYKRLRARVESLPFAPIVWDILAGNDPVQAKFVNVKRRRAEALGLVFETTEFSGSVDTQTLAQEVKARCLVSRVCGVIVQLPLPPSVQTELVLNELAPEKDIDQLRPPALAAGGRSLFVPPTAGAVLRILDSVSTSVASGLVVVVGQGKLVGLPTTRLLRERGYAVEVADARTSDLAALTRRADVLVTGVGVPGLITPDMVKAGATVIDAGTSESGGSVKGDVAPEVARKAAFYTPVPGGVGPVTVAVLMENAVRSAERMARAETENKAR